MLEYIKCGESEFSPALGVSSAVRGVNVFPLLDLARDKSSVNIALGMQVGGEGSIWSAILWLLQYNTHGTFQSNENQTASWPGTGLML